jgi:hypothetical protein
LKERHKQVEDSTKTIRNLQSDLEKFRESGGKWELREQDLRSDYDSRITLLNSKITGLEARLKRVYYSSL